MWDFITDEAAAEVGAAAAAAAAADAPEPVAQADMGVSVSVVLAGTPRLLLPSPPLLHNYQCSGLYVCVYPVLQPRLFCAQCLR